MKHMKHIHIQIQRPPPHFQTAQLVAGVRYPWLAWPCQPVPVPEPEPVPVPVPVRVLVLEAKLESKPESVLKQESKPEQEVEVVLG